MESVVIGEGDEAGCRINDVPSGQVCKRNLYKALHCLNGRLHINHYKKQKDSEGTPDLLLHSHNPMSRISSL